MLSKQGYKAYGKSHYNNCEKPFFLKLVRANLTVIYPGFADRLHVHLYIMHRKRLLGFVDYLQCVTKI